jgi:DNA-binding NarL/FixJ family response regulator
MGAEVTDRRVVRGRHITGKQRVGRPDANATTIGLIADDGPRETVAEILTKGGFAHVRVDLPRDGDAQGLAGASAVVLWLEGSISSSTRLVQPLTGRESHAPVVVACARVQRRDVRAALVAGVAGVVVHDDLAGSLGPCLHAVIAGQVCVPREHWRQVEPPVLSTREKQILGLVVMGYMNSQIAERLFLAESTVKSHLSSAFGKLGVSSRNEAVDLILNAGRGPGMGILGLVGESPAKPVAAR